MSTTPVVTRAAPTATARRLIGDRPTLPLGSWRPGRQRHGPFPATTTDSHLISNVLRLCAIEWASTSWVLGVGRCRDSLAVIGSRRQWETLRRGDARSPGWPGNARRRRRSDRNAVSSRAVAVEAGALRRRAGVNQRRSVEAEPLSRRAMALVRARATAPRRSSSPHAAPCRPFRENLGTLEEAEVLAQRRSRSCTPWAAAATTVDAGRVQLEQQARIDGLPNGVN